MIDENVFQELVKDVDGIKEVLFKLADEAEKNRFMSKYSDKFGDDEEMATSIHDLLKEAGKIDEDDEAAAIDELIEEMVADATKTVERLKKVKNAVKEKMNEKDEMPLPGEEEELPEIPGGEMPLPEGEVEEELDITPEGTNGEEEITETTVTETPDGNEVVEEEEDIVEEPGSELSDERCKEINTQLQNPKLTKKEKMELQKELEELEKGSTDVKIDTEEEDDKLIREILQGASRFNR